MKLNSVREWCLQLIPLFYFASSYFVVSVVVCIYSEWHLEFELCELRIYYKYNILYYYILIHVQVKHYQVEYSWNQNTTLTINVGATNLKVKLFFTMYTSFYLTRSSSWALGPVWRTNKHSKWASRLPTEQLSDQNVVLES